MSAPLARVIAAAIKEGILPPETVSEIEVTRPWPVVVLTALGAWLAALPLLAALFMLFGDAAFRGVTPYILGALALAGATAMLRLKSLPLFVEQLGVPVLLTGGLVLGIGLFDDLPGDSGAAVLAAVSVVVAWRIRLPWLRAVLGAAACALCIVAMGVEWEVLVPHSSLGGLIGVACMWFFIQLLPQHMTLEPSTGAALIDFADGWVLAALAGLAFWSGMTFLAGASMEPLGDEFGQHGNRSYGVLAQLVSALLAAGAAAWVARHWPSLRQPWSALAALVVVALAWLMPSLGAVMLVLAVCATGQRWRLAAAAGVAAAWIIGAFYYQLAYPLTTKALIMLGAGAVFGALAWMALRIGGMALRSGPPPPDTRKARRGIAACALVVLAVANVGIWQKESVIAEGTPIFVELGPVDPRSLMQGDYMQLAFRLPPLDIDVMAPGIKRVRVVGQRDARGIVTLDRLDDGRALAPGDIAIELTPARNGWTLVTDAWYFREGDASRWEQARYGEFRVAPSGRALLVGMRGADLQPLLTP